MSTFPSNFDIENIGKIVEGEGDWFSAQIIRLCHKADTGNRERLRLGFPDHVAAWEKWMDEGSTPYNEQDAGAHRGYGG